jgi:hypothetical protein
LPRRPAAPVAAQEWAWDPRARPPSPFGGGNGARAGITAAVSRAPRSRRSGSTRHAWRRSGLQKIPALSRTKRVTRFVLIDRNYWKSFTHARLGDVCRVTRGCLSLFAGYDHRLLAEHLTNEYRVRTQERGREVDEWRLRQPGLDNHGSTVSSDARSARACTERCCLGQTRSGRCGRR